MSILEDYPDLKNNIIFKDADNQSICKYISFGNYHFKTFLSGEEICSPDTKNIPVGIIVSGTAKIISADDQKNVLLRTVGHGAVFGISTLYSSEQPFPTKIYAKQKTEILFIDRTALCTLIENDTNAMRGYMTFLNSKIIYLNKKITAFTAGSSDRKLAIFLADNETDGIYISDVSLSSLSDMLDIGRASLYRAFEKLESEGIIEKRDRKIIIKNKSALIEKYIH